MIRIQIVRRTYGVESSSVKEFDDHALAAKWLTEDSYFDNPNVVKVVWEQIFCRHSWDVQEYLSSEVMSFGCRYCGVEFTASNDQVNEMFRRSIDAS